MAGIMAWIAVSLLAAFVGALVAVASHFALSGTAVMVIVILALVLLVMAVAMRSRRAAGFFLLLLLFFGGLFLATLLVGGLPLAGSGLAMAVGQA